MTDTPTPGEAAALPVAWFCDLDADVQENPACLPYVRRSDAQAIIHRLTNELDAVRAKLQDFALQALSDERQADELVAHQAAALPTIEAIMELATQWVTHELRAALASMSNRPTTINPEIARKSLRAALARALPVGEERDAVRELIAAAQSVIERWDTPAWKDAPHTAVFINRMRAAIDSAMAPKGETP